MRAGLLTRLFGYIGILGGAMLVLFPLPVVQIFWLGGLGMLFLGRWPGGELPAWKTGTPSRGRRPSAARGAARGGRVITEPSRRAADSGGQPGRSPQAKEASLEAEEIAWRPKVRRSSSSSRNCSTRRGSRRRTGSRSRRSSPTRRSTSRPRTTRRSGPSAPRRCTGTRSGTRCWTGRTRRSPSGSSGGKLNVAYNCLDRHVEAGNGDRVAYHWRGEEGEELDVTYADLHRDVQKLANALKDLGVAKGDVVAIYLPMIPEVAVAMLACARIGAIHNVVFGGFSAESVKERIEFSEAKALITVDGARRKGKTAPIKETRRRGHRRPRGHDHRRRARRTTTRR